MTPRDRLRTLARQGSGAFWRGLDELLADGTARRWLAAEFPTAFDQGVPRREVLKVMAASLVMTALSGCGPDPESPALPFVTQPESYTPGMPRLFATAVPFDGYAQPVVGECHAGRPTRLDGNTRHPMSGGAISAIPQAAILDLYDPERSQTVTQRGRIATWGDFEAVLVAATDRLRPGGGDGLRLLTGPTSSPTIVRQIDGLRRLYPGLRWHGHASVPGPPPVWPRLDGAEVVVSLEDDLLGPGPRQVAHALAWSRQRAGGQGLPLLFVAESTPSLTGAMAHRRLAVAAARIPALAAALAGQPVEVNGAERDWLAAVAGALADHPGRAVMIAGAHHPPDTQALCLALSRRWGEIGRTLTQTGPVLAEPEAELADLIDAMNAGRVETLLMLDVNPVYASPGALEFAAALARVPVSIHAGGAYDETAALAQWHLPLAHPLESWSDCRAVDGSVTILQPLIAPLFRGRTVHQILAGLAGHPGADAFAVVRDGWRTALDEPAWRRALQDGVVAGTAMPALVPEVVPPPTPSPAMPPAGIEAVFRPDPTIRDGRYANSPWLQELPKPLTKVVWDNVVAVSPALGRRLGLANGDLVEVAIGPRLVRGPAWLLPGQALDTVTLFLGYGRQRGGTVAQGLGYDAHAVLPVAPAASVPAAITAIGRHQAVVSTQMHHAIDGEGLVQVVAPGQGLPGRPRPPTRGEAWGMVIDTDLCIGCNSCVIACQAENNIPSVGREQVAVGRDMHWLRVDRYYQGDPDRPHTHFLPVPCMHCDSAPCELGCPVNATVHGPDGINEMVYNRCIGTRTCASYCPYKVRRFNFFDYAQQAAKLEWAQRNPEVSVRTRGVMEKCTYCIQRVAKARSAADRQQRPIADGEVRTACQNACPTSAIVFGNLDDRRSAVAASRAQPRNYALLDHLNTGPRTTYLARIRRNGAGED